MEWPSSTFYYFFLYFLSVFVPLWFVFSFLFALNKFF